MSAALLVPLAARCVALVSWGAAGPLLEPRRCLHRVREGHDLCGLHLSLTTAERPRVEATEGGVCPGARRPSRAMSEPRKPAELLAVRARLLRELAEVETEIAERGLGIVGGLDHRPRCRRHGLGPDGVDRYCCNETRHRGPCEFIYFAVRR